MGRREEIEKKIVEIEEKIEIEEGHSNPNRMPARNFIIFAIAGGNGNTMSILKHKVHNLLRNPDACEFLSIDGQNLDAESVNFASEIESIILSASQEHVEVSDLFSIFICPVIFAENAELLALQKFVAEVTSYMKRSGRTPIWQPFLLIKRVTTEYSKTIKYVRFIEDFLSGEGKEISNRCCLLSDQDANGFGIGEEDLLQTVATTVILQDVIAEDSRSLEAVLARTRAASNSSEQGKMFFTSRNSSISNPRRIITLQRMESALDFFSGKTDQETNGAIRRMNFKFLNEIVRPYLSKLPHHANAISFFPIYATMNGDDFHNRLESTIKKYYSDPINCETALANQLDIATGRFLEEYFNNNGSLPNLRELIKSGVIGSEIENHSMDCYCDIPFEQVQVTSGKTQQFSAGEYGLARVYCEKQIRETSHKLMQRLIHYLESSNLLKRIADTQECLDDIETVINYRLRRLREVESVLVVNQNSRSSDLCDVQRDWFEQQAMNDYKKYGDYNKKFDNIVFRLLKGDTDDYCTLLSICYDAVKNDDDNMRFLQKVNEECARDESRASEFIHTIKRNWGYTLRFASYDESQDVICVVGDPMNSLSRSLEERFHATRISFPGFDRIDVLRISAPFSPENIWEWEQINAMSEE